MRLRRLAFLPAALAVSALLASAQTPADFPATAPSAQAAKPAAPTPAYLSDPKFTAALNDARQMEKQRQYLFAIDGFKKANKIAGGECVGCLRKVYELQMGLGENKDAIATAQQLIDTAKNPLAKSLAQRDLGAAILARAGEKPKADQLAAAHEAFQSALTSYPGNAGALYEDACVLARMGNDADASKEFATCAAAARPDDPMTARARHFAEDPKLSLNKMAPAFEVTTLSGTKFNLDDMQGRVVLIDFWATWCGPCNEELPHLAKIVKQFAGQPLVVISISVDKDEAKWKQFVTQHEMTWIQYRDADGSIARSFGNELIPSYYMIGSDGVMLKTQRMGADDDVEGKIKKLLKQAHEEPKAGGEVASGAS
jgi:thiol-disulfide isomerase/thioredoxin